MEKDRMLVYLERHLRSLEVQCEQPDFVRMAKEGASYEKRRRLLEERKQFAADHADEIQAFTAAINFIRTHG